MNLHTSTNTLYALPIGCKLGIQQAFPPISTVIHYLRLQHLCHHSNCPIGPGTAPQGNPSAHSRVAGFSQQRTLPPSLR